MTHIFALKIGHTPNYADVILDGITLHFSYETVIGFTTLGEGTVVRENDWGSTTGKHLNALDGGTKQAKAERLPSDAFERALTRAMISTD